MGFPAMDFLLSLGVVGIRGAATGENGHEEGHGDKGVTVEHRLVGER